MRKAAVSTATGRRPSPIRSTNRLDQPARCAASSSARRMASTSPTDSTADGRSACSTRRVSVIAFWSRSAARASSRPARSGSRAAMSRDVSMWCLALTISCAMPSWMSYPMRRRSSSWAMTTFSIIRASAASCRRRSCQARPITHVTASTSATCTECTRSVSGPLATCRFSRMRNSTSSHAAVAANATARASSRCLATIPPSLVKTLGMSALPSSDVPVNMIEAEVNLKPQKGSEASRARPSCGQLRDEEDTLHQPSEAHDDHTQGGRAHHAWLPHRPAHPEEEGQEQRDHEGLAGLHPEVEAEEGEGEAPRRQGERLDGRGEAEAVHETEEEADEPALRRRVLAQEVFQGDPDDGQRDGGLDDAAGHRHHAQHGESQRDAMGDREGGDDLEEGEEATAPQQQHEQEKEMVIAGENVLDAELEEACPCASSPASADRDSGHARIGGEGQLPRLAVGLDLGQCVVVDSKDIEDIVLHDEILHGAPAREVEMHREAGSVKACGHDLARTRLAAGAVGSEHDLPA